MNPHKGAEVAISSDLQSQEAAVDHARAAIELLGAAHELYKRGPARPGRLLYHVGGLMVRLHDLCSASHGLTASAGFATA